MGCKKQKQNKQHLFPLPPPAHFKEGLTYVGYSFIVKMEDAKAIIVHL